jgi:predicted transcriptional regulator
MMAIPPALSAMARDRKLSGRDIQVYIVAANHLDYMEWRPLKLWVISREMEISRSRVAESLKKLTDRGYLARGERSWKSGPFTYRLFYSRNAAEKAVPFSYTSTPQLDSQ